MADDGNDDDNDEIKVILVGETGTGKTCLINTSVGLGFNPNTLSTVASTYSRKKFEIDNKQYILNLWDTAGQEQYRALNKIFIKHSKIVIFVYSITVRKTFEELDYWYDTIKEVLGDEPILGLVGNKKDLFLEEEVKESEGKKFAESKNISFQLVSAKESPRDFIDFLHTLLEQYIEKINKIGGKKGKNINLKKKNKKEEDGKCC